MATVTIDVNDLPARFAEALALARAGSEVIVAEAAVPVARLVPVPPAKPTRNWKLGIHVGAATLSPDFTAPLDEDAFLKGNV